MLEARHVVDCRRVGDEDVDRPELVRRAGD
jgi:hypothetical protein